MKKLVLFLLLFVLVYPVSACMRQKIKSPSEMLVTAIITPTDLPTPESDSLEQQKQMLMELTATPFYEVPNTQNDLNKLVEGIYSIDSNCSIDVLTTNSIKYEKPVLSLLPSTFEPIDNNYFINEIADNTSQTIRAYIACDINDCQEKLYLKNLNTGIVSLIDWNGRQEYRPLARLVWIGEDLLAFVQQNSPAAAIISVINVKEEKFILYWINFNQCQ
ncbi:hypothetical protein SDC9_52610 [bioreactor metagenome]|uniref:Uncharacterized protein n=1 Tax=bioreactor metagenome TaxID=1076179 RepID=A0A644WS22_9ZZZZ